MSATSERLTLTLTLGSRLVYRARVVVAQNVTDERLYEAARKLGAAYAAETEAAE